MQPPAALPGKNRNQWRFAAPAARLSWAGGGRRAAVGRGVQRSRPTRARRSGRQRERAGAWSSAGVDGFSHIHITPAWPESPTVSKRRPPSPSTSHRQPHPHAAVLTAGRPGRCPCVLHTPAGGRCCAGRRPMGAEVRLARLAGSWRARPCSRAPETGRWPAACGWPSGRPRSTRGLRLHSAALAGAVASGSSGAWARGLQSAALSGQAAQSASAARRCRVGFPLARRCTCISAAGQGRPAGMDPPSAAMQRSIVSRT